MEEFMTEVLTSCSATNLCPVNSYNEWDPLEEVIVGRLEGVSIPSNHITVTYTIPPTAAKFYPFFAGRRYPGFLVKRAQKELDEFIHILEAEGVTVRRPDIMDFSGRFKTPDWSSKGFGVTCPRDGVLIIGNEIIETPMPWRSRYFEVHAYRSLFKEYFAKGAKWISAPKPQLLDELYDYKFTPPEKDEPLRYVINEFEPVFDAADFIRCGRDIFVTKSNVTNDSGITWLRRHLGDEYTIHEIESKCRTPMHIDSTFMPLAPGKVLVNPDYIDVDKLPKILKSWDILVAPEPDPVEGFIVSMCSKWISLNVLMLDEKRVVVEKTQTSMIKALKDWGFEPIPCPFRNFATFGGSFHCATLDIRRTGELQSYF
jgi:glycine amidinotransferase